LTKSQSNVVRQNTSFLMEFSTKNVAKTPRKCFVRATNARFQNFAADAAKTTAVLHAVFGFFLTFEFTEAY